MWTSLCFTDQNSGREFAGWNQLPCGPVLTRIYLLYKAQDPLAGHYSPAVLKQFCAGHLDIAPESLHQKSYLQFSQKLPERSTRSIMKTLWWQIW